MPKDSHGFEMADRCDFRVCDCGCGLVKIRFYGANDEPLTVGGLTPENWRSAVVNVALQLGDEGVTQAVRGHGHAH